MSSSSIRSTIGLDVDHLQQEFDSSALAVPQLMHELPGAVAADPLGVAGPGGDATVQGRGAFENDERHARLDVFEEKGVLPAGRLFGDTFNHVDAGAS